MESMGAEAVQTLPIQKSYNFNYIVKAVSHPKQEQMCYSAERKGLRSIDIIQFYSSRTVFAL